MSIISYGIIGCGVIGPVHAHALAQIPQAKLIASCDINIERARKLASEYQAALVYDDYRKMIESPKIDAVCICTPHYLHAEMAIAAAEAGKHIFCEKPMALSSTETESMISAADSAGVQLGICFQHRFDPEVQTIKKMMDNGEFGTLLLGGAHCLCLRDERYYSSEEWRGKWASEGGGVLINQAIHTIDLLIHLFGRPTTVNAIFNTRKWQHVIEVEDTATAILTFANGAQGHIIASSASHLDWHTRLSVYGTTGSAEITSGVLGENATVTIGNLPTKEIVGNEGAPTIGKACYGNSHTKALQSFTESLLSNCPFPVSGREGRWAAEAVQAIYRSNNEVRTVDISER